MTKLIGTNPNQVPSNADLGTAAFMDKTEFLLSKGSSLSAINAVIPKTAVDVFVYDTSKDSDGGVWRKRTKNTSWYNERLNTTTRGKRKEFPAVAVLVLEAGGSTEGTSVDFTIYDGDDPDMPMWMQYRFVIGSGSNTGISALNGIITFCATDNGVLISDFIKDRMRLHNHVHRHTYGVIAPGRLGRSTVADVLEASVTGYSIVNQICKDVAMTVLPNAPIDSVTGLPVPTIAVATDGGVSVIKDDGTVANMQRGSNETGTVAFDDNYDLIFSWGTSADGHRHITRLSAPWVSFNNSSTWTDNYFVGSAAGGTAGVAKVGNSGKHFGINYDASGGGNTDDRLLTVVASNNQVDLSNYITSTYNTGWMNGDIKLATLSDTDDTNITSTNLITNGTFSTNLSGWSTTGSGTATHESGGFAKVTAVGANTVYFYQGISVTAGKTYTVIATSNIGDTDSTTPWIRIGSTVAGTQYGSLKPFSTDINNCRRSLTWTAPTSQTVYVAFANTNNINGRFYTLDNVQVVEAEEDRSVNSNGLQVFGTVKKTPVAAGADLVAYSGFSSSNLLRQPYTSDMDFGTGDICVNLWAKHVHTNGNLAYYFFDKANTNGTNRCGAYYIPNTGVLDFYTPSGTARANSVSLNNWSMITFIRSGTISYVYINGELKGTQTGVTENLTSSDQTGTFVIGTRFNGAESWQVGDLSLVRVSATAPTPEQIKKIYNDEKHLFQENAKCTLHGTSDAVTAMAYDSITETLHVGTSDGRSDFQGLTRVNNTTRAVGAAISAVDGFIVEE